MMSSLCGLWIHIQLNLRISMLLPCAADVGSAHFLGVAPRYSMPRTKA
jgi:hypothetical protein